MILSAISNVFWHLVEHWISVKKLKIKAWRGFYFDLLFSAINVLVQVNLCLYYLQPRKTSWAWWVLCSVIDFGVERSRLTLLLRGVKSIVYIHMDACI